MRNRFLWSAVILLVAGMGFGTPVRADEEGHAIPDKALCQTCAAHGATHGEEEVVAWRQYNDAYYYFCSKQCGETFDGFPEAYVPRSVPRPAPQMVLTTVDDETVVVGKADGEVLLLDFWATWCAPCLKAMPKLAKLQQEFASQNLSVVGVSIDEDQKRFESFMGDHEPGYRTVHDNGAEPIWASFYVVAIPAMVLIDGQGQIVGEWRGELDLDEIRKSVQEAVSKPLESSTSH
jgi:thiol-disulfide isomerase/thioredoxin